MPVQHRDVQVPVTKLHPHPGKALIVESSSLYMACTACQNVTTQPWTFWSQFCTEVYVTQYPEVIPMNTAVPHWAFLDDTVRVQFGGVKFLISYFPGPGW